MPLHKDLEYVDLHYTHPRHTIENDQIIVINDNVQYILFNHLTIESDSGIILESGAELIIT